MEVILLGDVIRTTSVDVPPGAYKIYGRSALMVIKERTELLQISEGHVVKDALESTVWTIKGYKLLPWYVRLYRRLTYRKPTIPTARLLETK